MKNSKKITVYPRRNSLNNISRCKTDLEKVLEAIFERDIAHNSKIATKADIKKYLAWFQRVNSEVFSFQRCTLMDLTDYKVVLISQYKAASINRSISSLKTLFRTAQELGITENNLALKLKSVPTSPLAPKSLTESETRKFMREVELRKNDRDRLIIGLMLYAGLRCSEVVALVHSNVQISARMGVLDIKHSKGNKSRKVPLNLKLRGIFQDFYDKHPQGGNPMEKIFQGQRGVLTSLAINKIIDKYSEKSGVAAHPHTFRHTFAYNFLKQNPADIVALAQILGHSNISTTQVYVQNRFEDLAEKIEKI